MPLENRKDGTTTATKRNQSGGGGSAEAEAAWQSQSRGGINRGKDGGQTGFEADLAERARPKLVLKREIKSLIEMVFQVSFRRIASVFQHHVLRNRLKFCVHY